MKVLVLGYYDRYNLGDDTFKLVITKILSDHECFFYCVDDFNKNIHDFDSVICGGGDIINDYFINKLSYLLKNFNGNIFALGIGIPFKPLIDKGYLDIFDHVFIRERTDLLKIQKRLGSQYANYFPDLTFLLNRPKNITRDDGKIGVFLNQQLTRSNAVIYGITKLLEYVSERYKIIFYSFCNSKAEDDDRNINKQIYESLNYYNPDNVEIDNNVYNTEEMLNIISSLEFAICGRFHSHVFSMICGTPFLSIYYTRKVELLLNEDDYIWNCKLEVDKEYCPCKVDFKDAISKFDKMVQDKEVISSKLDYLYDKYHNILKNKKVSKLLEINSKRSKNLDYIYKVDQKEIYDYCRKFLIKNSKYDPETKKPPNKGQITEDIALKLSNYMCIKITNMPGSKYIYGTSGNIMVKAHEIKEMIDYIYKDFRNDYYKYCGRLNINYIYQGSFKGLHRAGWQYVIDYMTILHNYNGVLLDTYIDRTFFWSKYSLLEQGVLPYTSPWIGFIHHTPLENYTTNNCVNLIKDETFLNSLIVCKGIICLTDYISNWFRNRFSEMGINVDVYTMRHPTVFPKIKFNYDSYIKNKDKKLVNVGAWYRDPFAIYTFNVPNRFRKCKLKGMQMENYFNQEGVTITKKNVLDNKSGNLWERYLKYYIKDNNFFKKEFKIKDVPDFKLNIDKSDNITVDDSIDLSDYSNKLKTKLTKILNNVSILSHLSNDDYDELFSSNIIFVYLVDASAANTIIECIVRNTPILVNKIEPVVEYLGDKYPLYYQNIQDIYNLLEEENNIFKAYKYLANLDKTKLTIEDFIESFKNSDLYAKLI